MKTIEDFFVEAKELQTRLESRDSSTIHTAWYEEEAREIFADWHDVKITLKAFVDGSVLESIDEQFRNLLQESKKANSSVSDSRNYLRRVEVLYDEYIYPKISNRHIEAGFVNSLISDLEGVREDKYREYMEEAIQCVQAGAYRGGVVLAWQAAVYALYRKLDAHSEPIHVLYQKEFNSKPDRKIDDFWDFQKIQDHQILLLAERAGLIDKSLKDTLEHDKNIRNKAAHPGVYDVGPNKTKGVLETVMQLLEELEF